MAPPPPHPATPPLPPHTWVNTPLNNPLRCPSSSSTQPARHTPLLPQHLPISPHISSSLLHRPLLPQHRLRRRLPLRHREPNPRLRGRPPYLPTSPHIPMSPQISPNPRLRGRPPPGRRREPSITLLGRFADLSCRRSPAGQRLPSPSMSGLVHCRRSTTAWSTTRGLWSTRARGWQRSTHTHTRTHAHTRTHTHTHTHAHAHTRTHTAHPHTHAHSPAAAPSGSLLRH